MVAYEDSLSRIGVESLQCPVKDLAIWFADALGIRNQNSLKQGRQSQALQFATLHADGAVCDQPELEARCPKPRQRLGRVGEEHTGIWKSGAVIVQQGLSHAGRKLEPRNQISEQRLPWSVSVAIELYEGLNVMLLACSLEAVGKPFPLSANELLETSTAIEQGAVKIEDHGLNIRSHLFYKGTLFEIVWRLMVSSGASVHIIARSRTGHL